MSVKAFSVLYNIQNYTWLLVSVEFFVCNSKKNLISKQGVLSRYLSESATNEKPTDHEDAAELPESESSGKGSVVDLGDLHPVSAKLYVITLQIT